MVVLIQIDQCDIVLLFVVVHLFYHAAERRDAYPARYEHARLVLLQLEAVIIAILRNEQSIARSYGLQSSLEFTYSFSEGYTQVLFGW